MAGYTPHQRGIIRRYYENRDHILVQRVMELVSQLYVAETDKDRDRLWKRVEKALPQLGLPPSQVRELLANRDVASLAKAVERVF